MDAPDILTALRAIAVPEKAAQMAAYMKNRFTFLGVATPERRQIGKPYLRADKGRAVDWAFIDTCWASPYREMHYIAADYLHAKQNQLTAADIPRLQTLISRNAWWDSVDSFIRPLGDILHRCPEARAPIEAMSRADDYWLRRAAITAQLLAKDATDTALLATVINNNLNQREFFINKAIGWALRQYSKTDAAWVRHYIAAHRDSLSVLSIREASKYLD